MAGVLSGSLLIYSFPGIGACDERLRVRYPRQIGLIRERMRKCDLAGVIRDVVEKRLTVRYRERGAAGLVSGRRGQRSNNVIGSAVRRAALDLARERCSDFGPTFARGKLVEARGFKLSAETPRDWFEGLGPACALIVYVDDATSRLPAMGFWSAETAEAYMEMTRAHLTAHGRPVAYYSDRHSISRVNPRGREGGLTRFDRALEALDIAPVHSGGPRAKGRVERASRTLRGPAGERDAAAGHLRHRGAGNGPGRTGSRRRTTPGCVRSRRGAGSVAG